MDEQSDTAAEAVDYQEHGARCPRCRRTVGFDGHPYGECTDDIWLLPWTTTSPWPTNEYLKQ